MARLVIATPVTTEPTVNTGKSLDGPPPATVTRFVCVAPLPVVAPVMVVVDGMVSVLPLVSVMVFAVAKTVASKVMLPPPYAADAASASRSVHDPLPEPVGLGGQLAGAPVASSLVAFTTYPAGLTVMACVTSAAAV